MVVAIQAITSLVDILQSSAYPSLSDMNVVNGLQGVLCHELPGARLCAAWCLRQICVSQPRLLAEILNSVSKRLNEFRSSRNAVEGHSAAISAILSATGITPHTAIVSGTPERILKITQDLEKPSKDKNVNLMRSKILASWFIKSGILALPEEDLKNSKIVQNIVDNIGDSFPKGDVKGNPYRL